MNSACLDVLLTKTDDPAQRQALTDIREAVRHVMALEDAFPERMAENKRKRGQAPLQLTEEEEEVVADSADAMVQVDQFDLRICQQAETPADALRELVDYQQEDADMWAYLASSAEHPDDRAAVEEVRKAKVTLISLMREYVTG